MSIVLALVIFSVLIVVHEAGHFLVAKRSGIRVEEFAVGMGPVLRQVRRGETVYSLRAFPLGGFNRIAGMESADRGDPRGFNNQSLSKRISVIAAGSGMNFLLAVMLFIIVFMVIGLPADRNVIGQVEPGRPAATAGLQSGDKILAIDNIPVNRWVEMVQLINERPEQNITMLVERDGRQWEVTLTTLRDPDRNVGLIGIGPSWERQGVLYSIYLGFKQAIGVTVLIITSLVHMITGRIEPDVVGPVGIVQLVGQAATFGLANILSFTAVLSVNLGLINLLPIPALDGSRLMFLGIEGIRGRPINPEKENFIHFVGFALLIGLLILITYQDLIRIFG